MIEARDLIKDYGRNRAVKGVSFRVEKGEIVGLLGPNGSGKTTIMRMLTGFFALKSSREEAWLSERYEAYPAYMARTKRFVPYLL